MVKLVHGFCQTDEYAAIFAHMLLVVALVIYFQPFDTGLNQIECATLSETERKRRKTKKKRKIQCMLCV